MKYPTLKAFEPAGVSRRTGHPRVKVPGIRTPIDDNIAPYIKMLKDIGLHPVASCGYESPYIAGQTPDKEIILVIRGILRKQGFVEKYDSEEGGLVFIKYDSKGKLIAWADADNYIGRKKIEKDMGLKTTDEYEWAISCLIRESLISEKGLKTIIEPFVDAVENHPVISKHKKGK